VHGRLLQGDCRSRDASSYNNIGIKRLDYLGISSENMRSAY